MRRRIARMKFATDFTHGSFNSLTCLILSRRRFDPTSHVLRVTSQLPDLNPWKVWNLMGVLLKRDSRDRRDFLWACGASFSSLSTLETRLWETYLFLIKNCWHFNDLYERQLTLLTKFITEEKCKRESFAKYVMWNIETRLNFDEASTSLSLTLFLRWKFCSELVVNLTMHEVKQSSYRRTLLWQCETITE